VTKLENDEIPDSNPDLPRLRKRPDFPIHLGFRADYGACLECAFNDARGTTDQAG
jgi:hypothetical protein